MRPLSNVKKIRKQLGLTQSELAAKSGLSQSLIAKIEAGITEPTYTNAIRIWEALDNVSRDMEPNAGKLMRKKLFTCAPQDSLGEVIKVMKKNGYSQVPVVDGDILVGMISETSIMEHVLEPDIAKKQVSAVMMEAPPAVSMETPESAIIPLLKHFPMVAVVKNGILSGIITKSDIIRSAYS